MPSANSKITEWTNARAKAAKEREEKEVRREKQRVDKIVKAFQAEFPTETWDCPICLETKPQYDSSSWMLCCGNRMCISCWRGTADGSNLNNTCLLCRADLPDLSTEAKEIAELERSAKKGRAWAQFELAQKIKSRDPQRSVDLFRKASDQGHRNAMHNLGFRYYTGTWVGQSFTTARKLFRKSSEKGNTDSMFNLGMMFSQGLGGVQDNAEAFKWITLAAAGDNGDAQANLAAIFLGEVVQVDDLLDQSLERAKHWAEKGARSGPAQSILAQVLVLLANETFDGNSNVPGHSPIPLALYWLREAEANGQPEVKDMIGSIVSSISNVCLCCGKGNGSAGKLTRCGRCKAAHYCGSACQKKHWKMGHKSDCIPKQPLIPGKATSELQ